MCIKKIKFFHKVFGKGAAKITESKKHKKNEIPFSTARNLKAAVLQRFQ